MLSENFSNGKVGFRKVKYDSGNIGKKKQD